MVSEGKGDMAGSWWDRVVSLAQGLCSVQPDVCAHPSPAHPGQVAPCSAVMEMAKLGMPTMVMKWESSGVSGKRG